MRPVIDRTRRFRPVQYLFCCRYPPTVGEARSFPVVQPHWWCSEWHPRDPSVLAPPLDAAAQPAELEPPDDPFVEEPAEEAMDDIIDELRREQGDEERPDLSPYVTLPEQPLPADG